MTFEEFKVGMIIRWKSQSPDTIHTEVVLDIDRDLGILVEPLTAGPNFAPHGFGLENAAQYRTRLKHTEWRAVEISYVDELKREFQNDLEGLINEKD